MGKRISRPTRWFSALATIRKGMDEIKELQEEYQDWMDSIPENLESSALYEKLGSVTELDVDSIEDVLDEADGIELPLGFGRD